QAGKGDQEGARLRSEVRQPRPRGGRGGPRSPNTRGNATCEQPASAAPGYQPMSASRASVERERPARSLTMLMLEAEARYARDRYELYRARAYGPRLTSARRLRELERKSKFAEIRLDRARADQDPVASVDDEHFF